MIQKIMRLLPKYNCGECGFRQCKDFGKALIDGNAKLTECPPLISNKFAENIPLVQQLIDNMNSEFESSNSIIGVIDGLCADFVLSPLSNEPSCREDILAFNANIESISIGDYVKYRPLGCPIVHFARVLNVNQNILTIHLVGPIHRIGNSDVTFVDISICMVLGFDGIVSKGKMPNIGQTVKFLPNHCMMQKIHSGVIVHSEGDRVRIEGVDLKVW